MLSLGILYPLMFYVMTSMSNCSCNKKFKFESSKEAMMFVNALNHYSKREDVQDLTGVDLQWFLQVVDDFKSFAMNFPADEGLIL